MGLEHGLRIGTPVNERNVYWRKENHLHCWFAENVGITGDNDGEVLVDVEQLEDLLEKCNSVLADHSKAEELLPTMGGFIFGPTDYDDYYFKYVEKERDELSVIVDDLKKFDPDDCEIVYWWWW